jgi:hypothetical protein
MNPPNCYHPIPMKPYDQNISTSDGYTIPRTIEEYILHTPSNPNINVHAGSATTDDSVVIPVSFGPYSINNSNDTDATYAQCNSDYRVHCTTYIGVPIDDKELCEYANCCWEESLHNATMGSAYESMLLDDLNDMKCNDIYS